MKLHSNKAFNQLEFLNHANIIDHSNFCTYHLVSECLTDLVLMAGLCDVMSYVMHESFLLIELKEVSFGILLLTCDCRRSLDSS